jgi:hypothetical protein
MFEEYVGPPENEIEFVGRFERLADDLVRALHFAGETFDERKLREGPPLNTTTWPDGKRGWSDALFEQVGDAEQSCLARFGYSRTIRSSE